MQRQLLLPRLSGVKKIKGTRKSPQPQVREYRKIKQYELFHRPFDLRFRGRLYKWLKNIEKENKVNLKDVLDRNYLKIVKLYLFPQSPGKKWINQDEVLKKVKITSKKNLRIALISSLIRIWKEDK